MDETDDIRPALNRASSLVLLVGVGMAVLFASQIVLARPLSFAMITRDVYLLQYFASILIAPVVYVVCSQLIRRASYGAVMAVAVLAGMRATRMVVILGVMQFNSFSAVGPYSLRYLIVPVIYTIVEAGTLVMMIRTLKLLRTRPNADAVNRARSRAGIALYVLAGLLLLVAAIASYAVNDLKLHGSFDVQEMAMAVGMFIPALIFAATVCIAAHHARLQQRPTVLPIAFVVALLLVVIFTDYGWYRGALSSSLRTVPTYFLAWCLIELLHGRRVCTGSPAQGFEPILPQPVIPITSPVLEGGRDESRC